MRAYARHSSRLSMLAVALGLIYCSTASAATSDWIGPGADFNSAANWSAGVPVDIAAFNTAIPLSISLSAPTTLTDSFR